MSEIQTIKTAIHEIAHAKLHAVTPGEKVAPEDKKDRRTKEVEAESVAYTVCQRYGIETSDYSFGYIAGWSSDKETKELKGSLETIRKTAAEMITGIDEKLKERLAVKEQEAPTRCGMRRFRFTEKLRCMPLKPVSWMLTAPRCKPTWTVKRRLSRPSTTTTATTALRRMSAVKSIP